MKKDKNKGFSLVELIIVVAIIAVLMAVIAPQYLRYVEKTKIRADDNVIDSLLRYGEFSLKALDYADYSEDEPTICIHQDGTVDVAGLSSEEIDVNAKWKKDIYLTMYGKESVPSSVFVSKAYKRFFANGNDIKISFKFNQNDLTFEIKVVSIPTESTFYDKSL